MRSIQLLEATHSFPCNIMVKVIGRSEDGFLGRVVAALRLCQQLEEDPCFRSRETPNGLHVAVTFEPYVETAEDVLVIYDHIRTVRGVVMVM
jgi:putative lipoic acid-binding regulatory protein